MRNHDQKNKDMCKSVLPSTSRKNARQTRRAAHGAIRAAERAVLPGIRLEEDGSTMWDADRRRRSAVSEMVLDRRSADKIGSLVRWARVTVERDARLRDASQDEVLAYFAGLLPNNTIGRHAIQHIEYGLFGYASRFSISYEERSAGLRAAEMAQRDRFRARVVALMVAGFHRDLNDALRRLRAQQLDAIGRAKQDGQRWDGLPPLVPLMKGSHALEEFVVATQDHRAVRAAVEQLAHDVL